MQGQRNILVIIPAGGSGVRVGGKIKKQFLKLADGRSILQASIEAFLALPDVAQLVVALPQDVEGELNISDTRLRFVPGGATRAASVQNGFRALQNTQPNDVVLVHDGVRPFVSAELIRRVSAAVSANNCIVPVMPVSDTIKVVDADGVVVSTPVRSQLRAAQTPQGFAYATLHHMYENSNVLDPAATDEAFLAECSGVAVATVSGDVTNIKITTPEDVQKFCGKPGGHMRVGIGYDVHRLVEGRRCVIGGIEFVHDRGLLGHSDADVLLHAICDGLLGAANLGDLGELFPDNDPKFKDADSKELLKECYRRVMAAGYRLGNLDTVVVCERPKIKPRREEIKKLVASILGVDENLVSIKATTEEKLGFTGREEGIAAWAYVSLVAREL